MTSVTNTTPASDGPSPRRRKSKYPELRITETMVVHDPAALGKAAEAFVKALYRVRATQPHDEELA